ncbi:TIGR02679 family protein [Haliangium ochraceum]|uniref:TIGR02679 family protein n=1 Tax=Haliangium ochraceum (strain DSM 14365 / JCM 11303 / SMP-2) TaxID=502025 RepID=D0LNF2_HALO1|nr:TIGR02679 family protein [Haliangium ochraceum]ACY15329.1 conserved hypothetical protein [Haliangium ochraceum DSM 14365]
MSAEDDIGRADDKARVRELRQHLGGPEYRKLFAAMRQRLEEAGERAQRTKLRDLDERERQALADLLGMARVPGEAVVVDVARLDSVLRNSRLAASLVEVVEALGGPLVDRPAQRRAQSEARAALWHQAAAHTSVQSRPELADWLNDLRGQGLLARAAQRSALSQQELLAQALAVVARLPADGMLLAVLAAETTGDAHALDLGRPLSSLVVRAAQYLAGWPAPPKSAAARRRLWSEVGVLCDPLSAQVLVLGLRPGGDCALARHLREWAELGEPRRLTLRELNGCRLRLEVSEEVFVCENPGVVAAAADALGQRCAPLVCTEGLPSTAAVALLRQLCAGGARVRFHADFDWAGIRIGNLLVEGFRATPWQFDVASYRAACDLLADGIPLRGPTVESLWDARLTVEMDTRRRAIFEEQVLETLITDLQDASVEPGASDG